MIKNPFLKFIFFSLTIVSLWVIGTGFHFLFTPLIADDQGYRYLLKPGTSAKVFVNDLTRQNIIKEPLYFKLLLRLRGNGQNWKAGEYLFSKGTTPLKMINQMIYGKGIIYRTFVIIAGWNFHQLREALQQDVSIRHTIQTISDFEIMNQMGYPQQPEGQFYPDTCYFMAGSLDTAILKRAYQLMQEKLLKAWQARSDHLPYQTPYDALIAASLIEKEAYLNSERPVIAGVLVNRLNKGMILQFDPTVIYSAGMDAHVKIQKKDLRQKNIFNTYVHKGLPPTPIAMASNDSILAALHPQENDYLYFVAKNDRSGAHQFSKTLAEHSIAIQQAKKQEVKKSFFNNSILKMHFKNANEIN